MIYVCLLDVGLMIMCVCVVDSLFVFMVDY